MTVKIHQNGYLVDGERIVAFGEEGNDEALNEWLKTNTPESMYTPLEKAKQAKALELKKASTAYKNKDLTIKVGGKNYTFFGGRISAQKYKEAYDLAILLGMPKGAVGTQEGLVEVTADDMNNILRAIGTQAYVGWKKLQYYNMAVAKAKSVKAVNAVVWEDKRG